MSERIAVIGSGALGGYYGGQLCRAGLDVHFLARSDAEQLRAAGLQVDSPNGGFLVEGLSARSDPRHMPACQTMLVCIKATGNADLPGIIDQVLAPGGTVVLVQNGLGQEERIAEHPRVGTVLAALGFVCASRAAPGHIVHEAYGTLRLAEYSRAARRVPISDAVRRVAGCLESAGIDVEVDDDYLLARWQKLVWNVPFNGLSVALRADTTQLVRNPNAAALVELLMHEVAAIAAAEGKPIEPDYLRRMVDITRAMGPYLPSMRRDFDSGLALEIDAMYWEPLRRAARHGVAASALRTLANQLEFLDRARSRRVDS